MGASYIAVGVLLLLIACLCTSLGSIAVVDFSKTPTADPTWFTPTFTATATQTFTPSPTPTNPPPPPPITAVPITPVPPTSTPSFPNPVVSMKITEDGRFGFKTTLGDPSNPNDDNKPLTFRPEYNPVDPTGHSNNTRVWVDGSTPLFGGAEGQFISRPTLATNNTEMSAVWAYNRIVFTQTVKVAQNPVTNRLDTFRITYTAKNQDTASHTVGVRIMLDTMIGENDGVLFVIPGREGVISVATDLSGNAIPDYIQVQEFDYPTNPGVIARVQVRLGEATPPDRVVLAPWCSAAALWDFFEQVGGLKGNLRQCGDPYQKKDSSLGIFYDPKPLDAGATRNWTFYYGLGGVIAQPPPPPGSTPGPSVLSLVKPAERVQENDKFYLTALVSDPKPGQKVKVALPAALKLLEGAEEKAVTQFGVPMTQISWLVQAVQVGSNLTITMTLSPENQVRSVQLSVEPTPTHTPTLTSTPTSTPTRTLTPTRCATSVTQPVCP